ncbi:hypothetical protein I7I53_10837 [Histoplasma capsulatum var. duboisii H88]|uniref:Uncharacterized protein n=1 Tax=Ajellomyces capsulatus (strain H88) TaxID=544711 RepID=A0A8A1LC26_AJEC8|nr:hypothetical protein I7I53_10837 [Histoplasma capsulatum var. duboisii H88]
MLMEDIPLPMDPREFFHVGGESVLRSLKSEFEVMDQDRYSSDLLAVAVEASSLSPDAEKGELRHVDLVLSQHLPRVASPKPPPGWLDCKLYTCRTHANCKFIGCFHCMFVGTQPVGTCR